MTDRCRWRGGMTLCACFISCGILLAGCGSPENPAPAAKSTTQASPPAENQSSETAPAEKSTEAGGNASVQPANSQPAASTTADQGAASEQTAAASAAQPEQPFHPPATLAELDKTVQWEDRPVRDSMKLLTEDLAKHPPQVSVKEALAMKNNTPEDNTKILSALGCLPEGSQQPNWNANFTRFINGDINSPNPIMVDTNVEFQVATLYTYELIAWDWNLIPYADADLVERWQTSKDHLVDKFTLRRDVTWTDGHPLTAHDFVFTYHAIMNPKIPVLALKTNAEKLRDVVAYDDYTLVFFHKQPLVTNVWNLTYPLVPKHIYEPLYAKLDKISFEELLQLPEYQQYELHPLSSYAYDMVSRVRNQEIVFKRREDWYMHDGKQVRAKPFFDEVRFKIIEDPNTALLALKSGRIDEYEIQQEQWATQTNDADFYDKNTKSYGVEWTFFYFGWNNNEPSAPFFKDRRVRQAMSYAVDYRELLDRLLFGLCQQCTSIYYPDSWCAPKTPLKPYVQNLDKAEKLLDEAGWVDSDGDGIRDKLVDGQRVKFAFSIIVKNDPERVAFCQLLQNNLAQLGIQCDIQKMEGTRLFDRLNKKQYQACFAGWGAGTDPDDDENVWATKYIADGRNDLQYSNPEVDRLFQQGRKEFDPEKRAAIYAKIDELIYDDQPCTFLYWRNSFWGWNKQLRGYKFSPRNPFLYSPGFYSIWKTAE